MDKVIRIKELVKELNQHSHSYYTMDAPTISDKEYDKKYNTLLALEKETNCILSNSPTQKVQGEILPFLTKVKHTEAMLSADKSKDINDIVKFMGNQDCLLSWKLDGLTIVLKFNEGKFIQAITRGGGTEGEDCTHTVRHFTNIPMTISYKGYLEIRGEGLVPFAEFERINMDLIANGEEPYSSPRNLSAGSVRQLDANITKQRKLIFIAFGIVKCDNLIIYKDLQFDFLDSLGFETVYHEHVNKNTVIEWVEIFKSMLPNLSFLTDGLIIEFNDIIYGIKQGFTGHHTKNMMALKHNDDSYETIFRGVELNTTRTGMVSITALFDTTDIDGVNVSRASLHNYTIFKEFELGVGNTITVFRANSVIPQLEDNLTRSNTYKIEMKCPSCGGDIKIRKTSTNVGVKKVRDSEFLFCENPECGAKLNKIIEHYCSKSAMNIEGLSTSTIKAFMDNDIINDTTDLYKLEDKKEQILNIERFAITKYNKLIKSINTSKQCNLASFIYALGIPNTGKSTSKELVKFATCEGMSQLDILNNILGLDEVTLLDMTDCGEKTALSICQWFHNNVNLDLLDELLQYIKFEEEVKVEIKEGVSENKLYNCKVYCTGKFSMKKAELKIKLAEIGCTFESGYKKSLDYLILGNDATKSSKQLKAEKDGVKLMTEEDMMKCFK